MEHRKIGFAFCGSNVFRINKILSVHELVRTLQEEFDAAVSKSQKGFA